MKRMRLACFSLCVLFLGTALAIAQPTQQDPSEAMDRGLRHYRQQSFQAALDAFGSVVAAQPDRAEVHYLMGYSHMMMRRYAQALESFSRAFQIDPNLDPRTIFRRNRG